MKPILDEASLTPCSTNAPPDRLRALGETLKALDVLGAPRVLHAVRGAADRDIGDGRGFRAWCFDRSTDRTAGLLVALRLSSPPYIDGADGLFSAAEGNRAVTASVNEQSVLGAGLVALTDGLLVRLKHSGWPPTDPISVHLRYLAEDDEWDEHVEIDSVASKEDVEAQRDLILGKIERSVSDGNALLARMEELFPRLRIGSRAHAQIAALSGSEPVFRQVIRHLRALDSSAASWQSGQAFEPAGVTYSVESSTTLAHGRLGPMRDFPAPDGYPDERWSLHTKMTGGAAARLYYRSVESAGKMVVLIGYVGPHLPTRSDPT